MGPGPFRMFRHGQSVTPPRVILTIAARTRTITQPARTRTVAVSSRTRTIDIPDPQEGA